jgi:hypothetical protein
MTQEVFVSTFIYPQNPENPTPNPSPSGFASRLRRETPSGMRKAHAKGERQLPAEGNPPSALVSPPAALDSPQARRGTLA